MNIGFYIFDDFQLLDLSGPLAAFQFVSFTGHHIVYKQHVLSMRGGAVTCTAGFSIESQKLYPEQSFDLLLVVGGQGGRNISRDSQEGRALKKACLYSKSFGSICTGAFVLAELGLLDGKTATTHWKYRHIFSDLYPDVVLSTDALFVKDGGVWTSAGISSGIDLALAIIEDNLGTAVSLKVAQELVVAQRRTGGQSQFSPVLFLEPQSSKIKAVLNYIHTHLDHDLRVESLAEVACLSSRQLTRLFTKETGETIAKAVEKIRLDSAKSLLETSGLSVEKVSRCCGFGNSARMRRAFQRHYKKLPQAFRN
ncbi:GlxA family transcriptional regulator [Pantoea dispersa]|uniref:GlxA family transcriptional regulator n=1 Tax=Pantoea dispersa TaxID=59814 RepID=UPI0009C0992B|nr:GlxA family transcriptional regulator [Pantoea dispersa]